ncbi:hypothetical protein ACRYGX_17465 [Mycobacteroides abscessus]
MNCTTSASAPFGSIRQPVSTIGKLIASSSEDTRESLLSISRNTATDAGCCRSGTFSYGSQLTQPSTNGVT